MSLDRIDRRILDIIQRDGKISQSRIADAVGLTTPSVNERIKKMEKRGVIKGYAALIDQAKIGVGLTAFIDVWLETDSAFIAEVEKLLEVQECHHITGEASYRLKVKVRDHAHLERLKEKIKQIRGVVRTKIDISLSISKESTTIAIPTED